MHCTFFYYVKHCLSIIWLWLSLCWFKKNIYFEKKYILAFFVVVVVVAKFSLKAMMLKVMLQNKLPEGNERSKCNQKFMWRKNARFTKVIWNFLFISLYWAAWDACLVLLLDSKILLWYKIPFISIIKSRTITCFLCLLSKTAPWTLSLCFKAIFNDNTNLFNKIICWFFKKNFFWWLYFTAKYGFIFLI